MFLFPSKHYHFSITVYRNIASRITEYTSVFNIYIANTVIAVLAESLKLYINTLKIPALFKTLLLKSHVGQTPK